MDTYSSNPSAAVLLILLREEEDYLLLTKRSKNLRKHAGEIALPGGMRDAQDYSLYRTALRETKEEVGVDELQFVYKGQLGLQRSRHGTSAMPFVVELREKPTLKLSEAEIESARWVPINLFVRDQRERTDIFRYGSDESWAPVYLYEDYEIWGLTARVIANFVNRFYGGQIKREHPYASEVLFPSNK